MPPSLSSIERKSMPRRKSCAACIKAKRRCDLRQPSCLRCSQRKIDCLYPTHIDSLSRRRSDAASSQAGTGPSVRPQDLMREPVSAAAAASWEASFDFCVDLSSADHSACPSFPSISFDEPAFEGLEFLNDMVNMNTPLDSIPPTPGPMLGLGLEDPMPLVPRPAKPQIAGVSRMQLLRAAAELTEKRLRYTIDVFERAPEQMILEGGTPWSHPALYRDSMPAVLEDALAACALHRAKNPVNTAMIQRVIEQRYQRLLAAPAPTGNAPEMMARTHALLLYQMMLFFDESCTARALTQETVSTLGDSAMALLEFTRYDPSDLDADDSAASNPSRNIPLYPLTTARAFYGDWTFQESLRRTLLITFLFTQLQSLLQADFSSFMSQSFAPTPSDAAACFAPGHPSPPDSSALAAIRQALQYHPYDEDKKCKTKVLLCQNLTLSAHLWRARDPVDFAVAWRDKKHLVAEPWNIWQRVDTAQVDDIDQLGRMLMTLGMGIEEAKGWFASRGGSL
ncbi:hypothetical protein F5Y12DRAFT_774507 [Xylaria sp. FL1777]|nr:hypothetical protein F5Y12DRAFT_774507 [Xylaria sp. FL1777]